MPHWQGCMSALFPYTAEIPDPISLFDMRGFRKLKIPQNKTKKNKTKQHKAKQSKTNALETQFCYLLQGIHDDYLLSSKRNQKG